MIVHGYTQYGLIEITINDERYFIPDDMGNRERQMVAEWERQGGVIPPYVSPTVSIAPLPRAAFWLAALDASVTKSSVLASIELWPDGVEKERARIMVEEFQQYRIDDPVLQALAASQGISPVQLENLWIWALDHYV